MQPAGAADQLVAGTQVQVVGVGEDDLRIKRDDLIVREALDRRARTDRHEHRRLDLAVRKAHAAAAGAAIGGDYVEPEIGWHTDSL